VNACSASSVPSVRVTSPQSLDASLVSAEIDEWLPVSIEGEARTKRPHERVRCVDRSRRDRFSNRREDTAQVLISTSIWTVSLPRRC